MSLWKHTERELAKRLGGERVPVTGRTGEKGMESPDIQHDWWSIEVKHRAALPSWLGHAIAQSRASLKPHHRAAIVILHEKGKRHDDDMVLLSLSDFEGLMTAQQDA